MTAELKKQYDVCHDCKYFVDYGKKIKEGRCDRSYGRSIEISSTDYIDKCDNFTLCDKLKKLGIKRKI